MAIFVVGCGDGDAGDKDKEKDQGKDAGGKTEATETIKVGVYEPLTGTNAAGGEMTLEGIELAQKLYPEILGKKVELVVVDNKSEKQEAANAVDRLINNKKVNIMPAMPTTSPARTVKLSSSIMHFPKSSIYSDRKSVV